MVTSFEFLVALMQVILGIMSLLGEKRYSFFLFPANFAVCYWFRKIKNASWPSRVADGRCISYYGFLRSTHMMPKFPFSHIIQGSVCSYNNAILDFLE